MNNIDWRQSCGRGVGEGKSHTHTHVQIELKTIIYAMFKRLREEKKKWNEKLNEHVLPSFRLVKWWGECCGLFVLVWLETIDLRKKGEPRKGGKDGQPSLLLPI